MRRLILLCSLLVISFSGTSCGEDDKSEFNFNEYVNPDQKFSILQYELRSIYNLTLERFGLKKVDDNKIKIKKIIHERIRDNDLNFYFDVVFPLPEFTLGSSPKLLLLSPRNKIERFDELLSTLHEKIIEHDNQVGLLVMIPGKYIGLDLFINNKTFRKYKDRLHKSHLIELLENCHSGTRNYEKEINSFMLQLTYGQEVLRHKKLGEEFSIYERDLQITSNALVLNNDLIHLTAINNMDRRYAR